MMTRSEFTPNFLTNESGSSLFIHYEKKKKFVRFTSKGKTFSITNNFLRNANELVRHGGWDFFVNVWTIC